MWSNFDHSNSEAGGGFMTESQTTPQSQKSKGAGDDNKKVQSVSPVMICHLNNANEAEVKIWNFPIRMVSVVAIVKNIDITSTKISYELEDETGTISAVQWIEAEKDAIASVKVNTYVQCLGLLREANNVKHIMVLKITPVTDLGAIVSHLLEVTAVILKAAKSQNQVGSSDQMDMSNSISNFTEDLNGMTKEQSIIFNIIQAENDSDAGIDRNSIKQRVPAYIKNKVDEILNFLSTEGHIYTTSTDDNFKTT